jgi:hypothetical protein
MACKLYFHPKRTSQEYERRFNIFANQIKLKFYSAKEIAFAKQVNSNLKPFDIEANY